LRATAYRVTGREPLFLTVQKMTSAITDRLLPCAASMVGRDVMRSVTHRLEAGKTGPEVHEPPGEVSGPLSIQLLGAPGVTRGLDRRPAPRGRKTWALLAYILATNSTPSREWLAELLFSDADDPLNALSWSLSQLRRLLGTDATVGGDPIELRLPPGSFVDIRALRAGTWMQALDLPGLGRQFLEGMAFPSSPAFEVWLLAERRHLAGVTDDVLREAARARLATGDARRAVDLASRLVAANPLDEDAQELLIRSYARAGDRVAAVQQRDACVALFRRELGTSPGDAVLGAADVGSPPEPPARVVSKAGITARLEAGLAAMDAGAIDAAIASLRQATADAQDAGDPELEARTLVALGSALVHGVRGRDGEGAELLHQAITAAERAGTLIHAAQAHRELGYVELLRARYDRAQRWVRKAVSLAADDPAELAWAHAIQGLALSDIGRHTDGQRELREALRLARQADVGAVETWSLTFIGRSHLLRREMADARHALHDALTAAHRMRWTAFVPLPESLLAEVDLAEGHVDDAAAAFEHAYALALQLGDPCWEGIAARGMGLVADRRGDPDAAIRWVAEARTRCTRLPDAWLWIEGYCLDALCLLVTQHRRQKAAPWIADFEALATRTGMRELVARAYLHRGRNGDRRAAEAARVLAAEVDNPAVLAVDQSQSS
jgi:DNA-binding SARP family transcriptional activator